MKALKSVLKNITTYRNKRWAEKEDPVAVEAPLEVIFEGARLTTLFCTPEKIDRLVLGFLYTEGLIEKAGEVSLALDDNSARVLVKLKPAHRQKSEAKDARVTPLNREAEPFLKRTLKDFPVEAISKGPQIPAEAIIRLGFEAQHLSRLFKATGGVHSAALADKEKILFFFEDIGRHNALDKLVGECLVKKIVLDDKFIILSGRLASEMLLKAARLKVGLVVSKSAPTTLSIELAEKLKITLVGFVRGERMNIYTQSWRVLK